MTLRCCVTLASNNMGVFQQFDVTTWVPVLQLTLRVSVASERSSCLTSVNFYLNMGKIAYKVTRRDIQKPAGKTFEPFHLPLFISLQIISFRFGWAIIQVPFHLQMLSKAGVRTQHKKRYRVLLIFFFTFKIFHVILAVLHYTIDWDITFYGRYEVCTCASTASVNLFPRHSLWHSSTLTLALLWNVFLAVWESLAFTLLPYQFNSSTCHFRTTSGLHLVCLFGN